MRGMIRIVRNFFFIVKSIRKWLAINYNDGIVPNPPVQKLSRSGGNSKNSLFRRSTPKIATSAVESSTFAVPTVSEPSAFASIQTQSPIKHCYSSMFVIFKLNF